MSERRVSRDELHAAIEARRELGPELEPHVVDAFVERIERRLDERIVPKSPAPRDRTQETAIAIVSILAAIPLIAIAGGTAGLPAIVAVCAALVLVNVVARR